MPARCCYRLDLQTSDLPASRLAGSAVVVLVGELGRAGPFELSGGGGGGGGGDGGQAIGGGGAWVGFAPGALDSFFLEGLLDLGAIQEARPTRLHEA